MKLKKWCGTYKNNNDNENNKKEKEILKKLNDVYQDLMRIRTAIGDAQKENQFDCTSHSGLNRIDDIAREVKKIQQIIEE